MARMSATACDLKKNGWQKSNVDQRSRGLQQPTLRPLLPLAMWRINLGECGDALGVLSRGNPPGRSRREPFRGSVFPAE